MKAIITDDEAPARKIVRQYLAAFPEITVVAECVNGLDAVQQVQVLNPHLLFLDIQMPGMNGFQVLEHLPVLPKIIFSTAYDQYALKAFEVNAVDYLLKPYDRARFVSAVQKALAQPEKALAELLLLMQGSQGRDGSGYPGKVLVQHGNRIISIDTSEIQFIRASGDYCCLHTLSGSYLSNYGISVLEEKLNPAKFLRVHRSTIIAIDALKALEKDGSGGYYATLDKGVIIRISRSYANTVNSLLL